MRRRNGTMAFTRPSYGMTGKLGAGFMNQLLITNALH
jgi:hypothetical protein